MSQMGMAHDEHHAPHSGYHDSTGQWVPEPHSYHNTPQHPSPAHEFNGFTFNPMPMEPIYPQQMHPPRTTHQQLQPLIMPQWPSMLTSQSSYMPPMYPTAPVPVPPASTPISATSTRSTGSTPRKTLTDADRRRMCLYHEEHPTVKQTEIGAMFGVERSTVSKVLRQKDKYLYQEDGSRSPIKRAKGKFPDIERALSNWARNHQKQGMPLTDETIREKARFFAQTVGNSDSHIKAQSSSWLEKFKQKNNLMGAKSRKGSLAEESEGGGSNPGSAAQTPNGISPTSPSGVASPSPINLTAAKLEDGLKTESPDSYVDYHKPFHSQSNTSLSSVFTDATASTYSAGPASPTSPFFTPDSACPPGSSPFVPSQQQRNVSAGPPGSNAYQRPRSQTFPMLGIEGALEASENSADDGMRSSQPPALSRTPSGSMHPPPLPNPTVTIPPHTLPGTQQPTPVSPEGPSPASPTQEDARRALELVMNFFQHQPNGFVNPQEYVTIGKLMEKLRIQRTPTGEKHSGGLHPIQETDYKIRTSESM